MPRIAESEARVRQLSWLGLCAPTARTGAEGARDVLQQLRMIQLDPLDPMGTNADLVALARVDGLARGEVYDALLPGAAFEHFAKERCLIPAESFATWAAEAPGRRRANVKRFAARLPDGVTEAVLAELAERGPCSADELANHGKVEALDWSGWKSTSKATTMALEVLWRQCRVVVHHRTRRGKRFALPEHALPQRGKRHDYDAYALLERVRAAGLLPKSTGPWWSMLTETRAAGTPDQLLESGALVEVHIGRRAFLALPEWLTHSPHTPDDRLRILGPLEPLLWDRKLVEQLFDFRYVWEVYKPAAKREYGWYVMPLLHRGQLVGRLEGRVRDDALHIDNLWAETPIDDDALDAALARHAEACRVERVHRPPAR